MDVTRRLKNLGGTVVSLPARITRRSVAAVAVGLGGILVAAGVAQIYVPAGYVVGGLLLAYAGLFLIDVDHGGAG